ncbi:MAG: DUF6391 domain-containing protein [Chloroflexi bacterium]|nr:DUF6391 domain-containing protein [Chloroflexota bacterium]
MNILHRLRQHHGIEHATMTVLSRKVPGIQLAARSDFEGFTVFGVVDTATLRAAAEEALARLQAGQAELAVHPNCGTNLVTAGTLAGVAAFMAGSGRQRSAWDRLPSAILGATLAMIAAVPLGRWMQAKVTTSPHVAGLRIVDVARLNGGPVMRHRVVIHEA